MELWQLLNSVVDIKYPTLELKLIKRNEEMNQFPPLTSGFLLSVSPAAGAGKDTVAEFLSYLFRSLPICFCRSSKEAAAVAFGIPLQWFNSTSLKEVPHLTGIFLLERLHSSSTTL